jgi:hypothetical protein
MGIGKEILNRKLQIHKISRENRLLGRKRHTIDPAPKFIQLKFCRSPPPQFFNSLLKNNIEQYLIRKKNAFRFLGRT